jgi:hypothetical protein
MKKYIPLYEDLEIPSEFTTDDMEDRKFLLVAVVELFKDNVEHEKAQTKFKYFFLFDYEMQKIMYPQRSTNVGDKIQYLKEKYRFYDCKLGEFLDDLDSKYKRVDLKDVPHYNPNQFDYITKSSENDKDSVFYIYAWDMPEIIENK